MSNSLALAAVTATLQFWLSNVMNDPSSSLGSVGVSAKAPDLTEAALGGQDGAKLAINLFLHQVTPNAAWRNVALPSLSSDGSSRTTTPPIGLDLHYLLTAYGSQDTEAEALLGAAVLMLHTNPVLSRSQIRTALAAVPSTNPYASVLAGSGLADQVEMIKVTPSTLGREEMAWLWTALKADYRPTYPFQVSVVLMEPQLPTLTALPVSSVALNVQTGMGPELLAVVPPAGQSAPCVGQTVRVTGVSLSNVTGVVLANGHLGIANPPFSPTSSTSTSVTFTVPDLPAGVYQTTVQVAASGSPLISSNGLLFAIAPSISGTPIPTKNPDGVAVSVNCVPAVLSTQQASLILAGVTIAAQPITATSSTLLFQFPAIGSGSYKALLQVDGLLSPGSSAPTVSV